WGITVTQLALCFSLAIIAAGFRGFVPHGDHTVGPTTTTISNRGKFCFFINEKVEIVAYQFHVVDGIVQCHLLGGKDFPTNGDRYVTVLFQAFLFCLFLGFGSLLFQDFFNKRYVKIGRAYVLSNFMYRRTPMTALCASA